MREYAGSFISKAVVRIFHRIVMAYYVKIMKSSLQEKSCLRFLIYKILYCQAIKKCFSGNQR